MPTTYDFIAKNKRRTWLLVFLFPLAFVLLGYLFLLGISYGSLGRSYYYDSSYYEETGQNVWQVSITAANTLAMRFLPVILLLAVVWIIIAYASGDRMIMSSAGGIKITKDEQPEIYRLVENLCISQGLPTPQIYIINDSALNAFATGKDPQHASIALTKGLVQHLERAELEGVIAHELAHIKNYDIRLMLITVVGIAFFTFVSEMFFQLGWSSAGRRTRNHSATMLFFVIGTFFAIYGFFIAPMIRLAVSRKREYLADATAALITRNPEALARALEKISKAPHVYKLEKHPTMAAMCIENPLNKVSLFSWLSGMFSTHPPTEKRIAALRQMARGY